MSLTSPLPWFAICALCLAIGAALAYTSRFYRAQLAEEAATRFQCVDGLRGFLALGVFAGHAVNMYTLHTTGRWAAGLSPFHMKAAAGGVAVFFMITGFLFWLRVLRAGAAFDARAFFLSRLRRLTPMYAMSVLMAIAVVGAAGGFALHVGPAQLAHELRAWLSFGFLDGGALNGFEDAPYVNAVYWTLAYEWMFYVALPFLALFARGRAAAAALVAAVLVFGAQQPVVYNFLFGAAAAWIVHRRVLERRALDTPVITLVPLAALCCYFILSGLYGLLQSVALFGFFIFIVHGNSLFGLLRTRAARLLGLVSYSIYLTHCMALFVTVHAVDRRMPIRSLDIGEYWLLAALAAAGCVLLSALTYRYVEHPFIHSQAASKPTRAIAEITP